MLNTIIIEDERPAREIFLHTLSQVSDEINLLASLSSVKESIKYLNKNPDVDLIFSDVQLSDGLSFEIFEESQIKVPVIFITGFDEFMINSFEYNGIDYLLKPVEEEELRKALLKYRMLENHFISKTSSFSKLIQYPDNHKRTRIVAKKGIENIALLLEDVVVFYTENKIVYAVDNSGKKYLVDKNLSELDAELDELTFFRANRQFIVNLKYVKGFKPYEKVKLLLDISPASLNEQYTIIISQEMAPSFRKWIYEA